MKPTYIHDCRKCVFLGNYTHEGTLYDLYVCSHKDMEIDTVIARCGNDGPDYASGIYFRKTLPYLKEAYERAITKGYKLKRGEKE